MGGAGACAARGKWASRGTVIAFEAQGRSRGGCPCGWFTLWGTRGADYARELRHAEAAARQASAAANMLARKLAGLVEALDEGTPPAGGDVPPKEAPSHPAGGAAPSPGSGSAMTVVIITRAMARMHGTRHNRAATPSDSAALVDTIHTLYYEVFRRSSSSRTRRCRAW